MNSSLSFGSSIELTSDLVDMGQIARPTAAVDHEQQVDSQRSLLNINPIVQGHCVQLPDLCNRQWPGLSCRSFRCQLQLPA